MLPLPKTGCAKGNFSLSLPVFASFNLLFAIVVPQMVPILGTADDEGEPPFPCFAFYCPTTGLHGYTFLFLLLVVIGYTLPIYRFSKLCLFFSLSHTLLQHDGLLGVETSEEDKGGVGGVMPRFTISQVFEMTRASAHNIHVIGGVGGGNEVVVVVV
jgi:hypothetical protein